MRSLLTLFTVGLLMLPLGCSKEEPTSVIVKDTGGGSEKPSPAVEREVVVQEVIPGSRYTYLRVKDGPEDLWIATGRGEFKKGESLRFGSWLEMTDFTSKELKRTFKAIYFIQNFGGRKSSHGGMSPGGAMPGHGGMPGHGAGASSHGSGMAMPARGGKTSGKKIEVTIKPAEGGITIGEVFAKRKNYAGKQVLVRGKVVKFSPQIMGKNWVHIQDGTGDEKDFDLTVTTMEAVKVGDIVTFEGTINLDKDLGSGYKFPVLMEEAKRVEKR